MRTLKDRYPNFHDTPHREQLEEQYQQKEWQRQCCVPAFLLMQSGRMLVGRFNKVGTVGEGNDHGRGSSSTYNFVMHGAIAGEARP